MTFKATLGWIATASEQAFLATYLWLRIIALPWLWRQTRRFARWLWELPDACVDSFKGGMTVEEIKKLVGKVFLHGAVTFESTHLTIKDPTLIEEFTPTIVVCVFTAAFEAKRRCTDGVPHAPIIDAVLIKAPVNSIPVPSAGPMVEAVTVGEVATPPNRT